MEGDLWTKDYAAFPIVMQGDYRDMHMARHSTCGLVTSA
jgi:hypothetical protein